MTAYNYKKVDAFTSGKSLGNPAAYLMIGGESLDPSQMLAVGKEHAGFVSEIVFCSDSDRAEVKLTYYSSECEVDFCGHGTIAAMYDLIKNDERLSSMREILFETNRKGILKAYNYISSENAVYISAPEARYLSQIPDNKSIAEALGTQIKEISIVYPTEIINAGLTTLIVPIERLETEVSVYPDINILKEFCIKHGIDIILIFCMDTETDGNFAHTRVFAPKYGYLEDPATGSGNSAFGNYLLKNKMWEGSPISIEQGGNDRIFNIVKLRYDNGSILFGGGATAKITGKYFLTE